MFAKEVILLIFVVTILRCHGTFVMPEVSFEAYKPKGFRASIPALKGIELFAFHGNVNKEIQQTDPGEYSEDLTSPTDNNMWSYFNDELSLKEGDVIYYWVFIQYERLGYRKDAQKWTVTKLLSLEEGTCEASSSSVAKKSRICKNNVIFEDNFNTPDINETKWTVEAYIPFNSEDYEFVSYQNSRSICYTNENKLYIKPQYATSENEVRGVLDLGESCTRKGNPDHCHLRYNGVFILPPVTSGRLVSSINFRYGSVEIRAKLPAGDWIYPQIYLEEVNEPKKKLWVCYARGNDVLLANSGEDIGSRLLFGGPVFQSREPGRSTYLKSTRGKNPFTSEMHTYKVTWSEASILLYVDGVEYSKIDTSSMQDKFAENDMARLVLGLGVGGVNDFPDNFKSGQNAKPWRNRERKQIKNFFEARNIWSKTWNGDNSALQVEYVKISAL